MKKLISLTLAIMLVLSLSVPALAAEGQNGSNTVPVTARIPESYTVILPDSIDFGNDKSEVEATVSLGEGFHLASSSQIDVTVQGGQLTNGSTTLRFGVEDTSGSLSTSFPDADFKFTFDRESTEYKNAPIGNYNGSAVFFIEYMSRA